MKRIRNDGVNKEQQETPLAEPEEMEMGRRGMNPQNAEEMDARMAGDPNAQVIASPPYEEEPMADDILPDHIERFANAPEEDDDALTARPSEPIRPYHASEYPDG